jgi:3-isopropylmalate/(R)-2-methylmalate dehydratase small subunit
MSAKFASLKSRVVPLSVDNIDTDQIIPARYLKGVDRQGLGAGLFANWRGEPDFVLNQAQYEGAKILLAGENFGCGSSREHAPWALHDYGFRAVISSRFADIFNNNSLKNGLLPVALPVEVTQRLHSQAASPEGLELEIDLESLTLKGPDGEAWTFTVDPFARHCLLEGVDQLGYLLRQLPSIEAWEQNQPQPIDTRLAMDSKELSS